MPDVDLVRAAQSGDSLALSELLDFLAPRVGRLCASIALDDGADAAQEALVQVMRDLRTLRDPRAFHSWARRIATREAVRHAERARRARPEQGAAEVELPPAGDPLLARDVRCVLASLPPEQRAILVLRDLEGFSEAEAAAELDVAKGTVKSRLHRARQAFRERWRR